MPTKRSSEASSDDWILAVNAVLKRHRHARNGVLIRFGATKYPFPTISVQVFADGKRIAEYPITNLEGFIEDLKYVHRIVKEQYIREAISRAQSREEEEEESQEEERTETRRTRRRRRAPKRD